MNEEIGSHMSDKNEPEGEAPKKRSKLPLIIGLVLMIALGGGGFYAVYSGLILGGEPTRSTSQMIRPCQRLCLTLHSCRWTRW